MNASQMVSPPAGASTGGGPWDIAVIGSGIAGLTTALAAAERGARVVLLTKAGLTDSATREAQGGIAAVLSSPQDLADGPGAEGDSAVDDVAAHIADTLTSGAGLAEERVAEVVCSGGGAVMDMLIEAGTTFDFDATGALLRGLEGAHSAPRVFHAAGDATGQAISFTMAARARDHDRIEIREHTVVSELLLGERSSGSGEGRAVVGVRMLGGEELRAAAVVLATGGAGRLYPRTTNPGVATGDGLALAARAGVVMADVEFVQFHPTALALPGSAGGAASLISEAVRGEGAVLRDAAGARFMTEVHHDAELAPRDVVARAISRRMRTTGAPVLLDATALGADFLTRRFPTINAVLRAAGLDWASEPVPITPAAHYLMGGVATDTEGRTSIPGLFAVGEVACTGLHGANRLASNSLLEAAVIGRRAAAVLSAWSPWQSWPMLPDWVALGAEVTAPAGPDAVPEGERTWDRARLQSLMWQAAGLERDAERLAEAADTLGGWAPPAGESGAAVEDANLLTLARAVVAAASARWESRGAHWREDAQQTDEIARHSIVRLEER